VSTTKAPVLLIHGFASSFAMNWTRNGWPDLLADIGRTTIGVDLLGHGTAPKPHDPQEYLHLENRIFDALPDEGAVDAVGFSMGAMTLVRALQRDPHRFGRVILAGIGENNLIERDPEPVARMIEGSGSQSEGDEESSAVGRAFSVFAQSDGNDPKALAACQRCRRPMLTLNDFAGISNEALFVLGDKDFVGSAQPLVSAMPNARLHTLRNVDHFGTPQNFGFLDAALEFFA
jgi:pimeloyl-ACP methyl ester carboxylesterase